MSFEKFHAPALKNERSPETETEVGADKTGEIIEKLKEESNFKRFEEKNGNCVLESKDGEKFTIELITSPGQREVEEVQNILYETFNREEVDPVEVLKAAIKGETPNGEKDITPYKVYTLKNEKGEIIALRAGGVLDLKDEFGADTNEVIFMGTYIVTQKNLQQKGFARELFISSLIDAKKEAENKGKKFKAFAGEVVSKAEYFQNNMGVKRAYLKTSENVLEEIKYIQPPTEWNPDSGNPAERAASVPEHFMVLMMDGRQGITSKEVLEIVDAFYRWTHRWRRSDFNNKAAFLNCQRQIDAIEEELRNQLSRGDEKLILLSKEERRLVKESGIKIFEHTSADEVVNQAGEEDL